MAATGVVAFSDSVFLVSAVVYRRAFRTLPAIAHVTD